MVKYKTMGDITRNYSCKVCDRKFKGEKRDVNKQIEMHYKYLHKDVKFNDVIPDTYIKIGKDITTSKLIINEDTEDLLNHLQR